MASSGIEISRHSFATRLLHMGLATVVMLQLLTSLWMTAPRKERQADWLFVVHEYCGVIALSLALGTWLVLTFRRRGTAVSLLFPWLNASRRRAVWEDLRDHWQLAKSRRLPGYHAENPLASAIHGLGLLLMTAMAASGTLYFVALYIDSARSEWASIDLEIHQSLANLAWVYLVAHAGFAIVHHYAQGMNLREMWSLRK